MMMTSTRNQNREFFVYHIYGMNNVSNLALNMGYISDLGIIIDDKLTFSCHILSSTKKAYKQSIIMSRCFLSKKPTTSQERLHFLCSPNSGVCIHQFGLLIPQRHRCSWESPTPAFPNLSPIFDHTLILLASLVLIFSLSMFVAIILTSSLASASSMDLLISTILHSFPPRLNSVTRGHPYTLIKPPVRLNTSKFHFFLAPSTLGTICLLAPSLQALCPLFKFKLKFPPVS